MGGASIHGSEAQPVAEWPRLVRGWMLTVSTEPATEEIKHGAVKRRCLIMSENLQQPRARRPGNPKWVPGVSGNPGGKTKARMELQASIEKIHAGPLALQALDRLRRIGMGITTVKLA